jgi:hypothetical protein
LFCFFEAGSPYVTQAGFVLLILLPLPPECWDYRCELPYLTRTFFKPETHPIDHPLWMWPSASDFFREDRVLSSVRIAAGFSLLCPSKVGSHWEVLPHVQFERPPSLCAVIGSPGPHPRLTIWSTTQLNTQGFTDQDWSPEGRGLHPPGHGCLPPPCGTRRPRLETRPPPGGRVTNCRRVCSLWHHQKTDTRDFRAFLFSGFVNFFKVYLEHLQWDKQIKCVLL